VRLLTDVVVVVGVGRNEAMMWEGSLQVATDPFAGEVIDRIGLLCDAARLATATATAARSAVCTVDGEKQGERGNNSTTQQDV
jgi:hypothetical protein